MCGGFCRSVVVFVTRCLLANVPCGVLYAICFPFSLLCLTGSPLTTKLIIRAVVSDIPLSVERSNRAVDEAWALLLAARDLIDAAGVTTPFGLHFDVTNSVAVQLSESDEKAVLRLDSLNHWIYPDTLDPQVKALFDLYLPFLSVNIGKSLLIGHLGQSIDAQIATKTGDAFFVTGPENRKHLHRMRALADAVVVGVETVITDDPQLTTREVDGPHPVRVVIDPSARMPDTIGLITDKVAPTWQLHGCDTVPCDVDESGLVKRVYVPLENGRMKMSDIVAALAERGLHRLFIEGGGVTVSGMLTTNCLDYLQIATAPVFVGSGRSSVQLPTVLSMNTAFRPPYALYRMGADVLWNFDVRDQDASSSGIEQRTAHAPTLDDVVALERLL